MGIFGNAQGEEVGNCPEQENLSSIPRRATAATECQADSALFSDMIWAFKVALVIDI